jgi:hypothetical protein
VKRGLAEILAVYHRDNSSVWDCRPEGTYVRRTPPEGVAPLAAQTEFIRLAAQAMSQPGPKPRRQARKRRPAASQD